MNQGDERTKKKMKYNMGAKVQGMSFGKHMCLRIGGDPKHMCSPDRGRSVMAGHRCQGMSFHFLWARRINEGSNWRTNGIRTSPIRSAKKWKFKTPRKV